MSQALKRALIASMENVEGTNEATEVEISEILELAEPLKQPEGEAPLNVGEIVEEVKANDDVVEVLEDIAEAAATKVEDVGEEGPGVVAVESLAYTLGAVLKSHGVALNAASLESDSPAGQAKRISEVAIKAATGLRQQMRVSVESHLGDVRSSVQSKAGVLAKSKTVLAGAISKINSRSKEIAENPVKINHKGIYDFLHRNGEPVTDLKGALKDDIKVIESLRDILKEMAKEYDGLAAFKDASSEAGVNAYLKYLSTMNYGSHFGKVDGAQVLKNGQITVQEGVGYGYSQANGVYLQLDYEKTENDGSKNTAGQRALSSSWRAGLGLVIGAGVGSLGGAVGAAVGGAAGAALGVHQGIKAADYKERGSNTDSVSSVSDVVEFLKDAQKICELSSDILVFINTAQNDDQKARQYLKAVIATIEKDDKFATAAMNIGMKLLTAAANSRGAYMSAPTVRSHKQQLEDSVGDMLEVTNMAYTSVLDALATHCFTCVTGAMEVANAIVKAEG